MDSTTYAGFLCKLFIVSILGTRLLEEKKFIFQQRRDGRRDEASLAPLGAFDTSPVAFSAGTYGKYQPRPGGTLETLHTKIKPR